MTDVTHRAMLASLTQRAWKATATDRDVASQAEQNNDAESGSMKVIKELTPKYYIQPIKQVMTIGYNEFRRMTVPGFVRGQHLLSTALFDRCVGIQATVRDEFWEKVDRFVAFYPEILSKAPARLGRAYKDGDFPSKHQIRSYFDYSLKFAPIPDVGNDWRLEGISEADTDKIRNEIEDNVRKMYNCATQEIYNRAREILEKIVSQAESYTAGPGSSVLRDATIDNLKEISELVCQMNISADPLLDRIGNEMIREFAAVKGSELRKNATMRESVAAAAKAILGRIPKVQ